VTDYRFVADRLRIIADELDDASFTLLHDAVAEGATQRPQADKTLTQARRAIEKAAALIESLSRGDPDPEVD
jgi:hypothetical protein